MSLNSSKSSASFCNIFLQQNFPITFPSPPLLPAELKSIILVLPRARVRYLCGMVGKRKWGTRGWVHFALEKFCLKRCSLNAALSTSQSSHIFKCSSSKFQLFCSKTCRSKLQEEPIQENPFFFVTHSFSPFAIFREESFSLKSITWAVWPWALSDMSSLVKKNHVLMLFISFVKILDSNFPNCSICLQLINSEHKGPSIKIKK